VDCATARRRGRAPFAQGHTIDVVNPRPDDFVEVSLDPDPVVEEYKKSVDRTLLRERLKLTIEERLRDLMRLQAAAEELRAAGRQAFR
jgi:hypothetical protein